LFLATLELVRSTPIKQRLVNAYRRHLAALPEDQLPSDARDTYKQIVASLSNVSPLRGEDAVAASVRKMSNQEADDCAALITELFGVTCRSLLSTARASAEVVQLHSAERESEHFEVPALIASN
jgi:hypothetical protein